ncbi:MAG: hypothetical protein PHR21_06945 [Oscillospiraceae bacterium]|nr:hypothetical protein [Oscillospiraceae bacterium]
MSFLCKKVKFIENRESYIVLISSHRYMSGTQDNADIWRTTEGVNEVIPLYDLNYNIRAYYISFYPMGYAIINNNLENPVAIEFGDGDNGPIRDILEEATTLSRKAEAKIVYLGPSYSFDDTTRNFSRSQSSDSELTEDFGLEDMYAFLDSSNAAEKEIHTTARALALSNGDQSRGGSYDFIDWNSMPSGSYSSDWLPFSGTTWAVMSNYTGKTNPLSKKVVNDHCGATAATNLSLYFATQGYSNLKKNGSVNDTFYDLHNRTGNGPVLTIADSVSAYATSRGYTINNSSVSSYTTYKTAITNKRPCGILLTAAVNNWHWVVGVGYRQYSSGGNYVRVVTGWENSANNFYLWGSPATWSISQYWI